MKLLHLLGILLLWAPQLQAQDLRSGNLRVEQLSHKTVRLSVDLYARLHASTPMLRICWGDGNCEEWITTPEESWPAIDLRHYHWDGFHGYALEGEVNITVEACCWTQDVVNIPLDAPQSLSLATDFYVVQDSDQPLNTTPTISPHFSICETTLCNYRPKVEDIEGDSLVWESCQLNLEAYRPLSDLVENMADLQFDSLNGHLTWNHLGDQGWFNHITCLNEYRNGQLLSKTQWQVLLYVEGNTTTTSVAEKSNTFSDWTLYPNPTQQMLHWSHPSQAPVKIAVYDYQGQLLKSATAERALDVSDLPSGLYFLKLRLEGEDQGTYQSFVKH